MTIDINNLTGTESLEELEAASPGTVLLHGVTGSGKTTVYIEYAKRMPGIHIIPCMEQNRLKSIEDIGKLIDAELFDLLQY